MGDGEGFNAEAQARKGADQNATRGLSPTKLKASATVTLRGGMAALVQSAAWAAPPSSSAARMSSTRARADSAVSSTATRAPSP